MTPIVYSSPLLRAQLRRIKGGTLAFILILALLFMMYAVFDHGAQMRRARKEAQEIADMAALNANGTLRLAHQVLMSMQTVQKYMPESGAGGHERLRQTLLGWQKGAPNLMDLLVVEPPGKIVCWTGKGNPPDVSDRAYVSYHLQHKDSGMYVGEPKISKVHENKWFFGVSEAERDASGAVIRVVVAIIDIDAFRASLKANFSLPGSTLALVSKSGQIYMRSEDHDKYVGRQLSRPSEATDIVRGANRGSFIVQSPLDSKERMVAFHRLDDQSMYAVGTVSLSDVLLPWRERLALLATLWLALSAVASWFAYRLLKTVYEHEALAMTDGLTGVLNRRSLLSIVAGEERRANNDQQQAVLMVDVDHFKMINDNQGHVSGDAILRQVAQILRASCRDSDLVGRYGGEEFLIILDDTSIDGAMTLAEKLRATVTTISLPFGQVTVSIGVAVTCTFDNTLEGTIRRADQAMYVAKAAGRNRVILDDSSREGEPLIDQQI